jgi:hypothetical protein
MPLERVKPFRLHHHLLYPHRFDALWVDGGRNPVHPCCNDTITIMPTAGGATMRHHITKSVLQLVVLLACWPVWGDADWKTGLTTGWQPEDMQAWGDGYLAVDFGADGLWSYAGQWVCRVCLSRMDPRKMEAVGGGRLAVDFGPQGLWLYDARSWTRIAR